MNYIPTVAAVVTPFVGAAVVAAGWYWLAPSYTDVGYQPEQPVPFSHAVHNGQLGLDCRYCHNTVEYAARAAVPPTATCMNCHQVVKPDSPKLAAVRESFETGDPIRWVRVHQLPDYAYFDHSIHVAASVGCESCHGRVDQMEVVRMDQPLSMGWCLECHRAPEQHLRPKNAITSMGYMAQANGHRLPKEPPRTSDGTRELSPPEHCSGCHR